MRRMNGKKVAAVKRVGEVELLLFALDLALEFVAALWVEVEEVRLVVEVGEDEMDLVEAYGKYGDSKSGNGLVLGFVGVGAGNGSVNVNGPSISSCLSLKGVSKEGSCGGPVDSAAIFTAGRGR